MTQPASLFNESAQPTMSEHERRVFARLRHDEPIQLDGLMEQMEDELGSAEIFTALFELELAGRVKALPGKNYVRCF
jgi:DNA processing protein